MQQLKCHFIRERKYSSFSLVHYSCVLLMKSLESERDREKRWERERERGEKVNSRKTKARKWEKAVEVPDECCGQHTSVLIGVTYCQQQTRQSGRDWHVEGGTYLRLTKGKSEDRCSFPEQLCHLNLSKPAVLDNHNKQLESDFLLLLHCVLASSPPPPLPWQESCCIFG